MGKDLAVLARRLLRRHGIRIRRRLSQHFVVDTRLVDEVVGSVRRLDPAYVVEVGTGLGFLTLYLSDAVRSIVSVEIDRRLAEVARRLLKDKYGVNIVVADGVEFVRSALRVPGTIVSNVPYSVTGPLLTAIIKSNCSSAVLTLQDEVASRLVASPGSRSYSRLSVMVNTFMEVELGGKYPPNAFYPPPKVSSRVVVMKRVRTWDEVWDKYEVLVRCMFNQRRKLAKRVLSMCANELGVSLSVDDAAALVDDVRVYDMPVSVFTETFLKILDHSRGPR